jgi:hypothetical protein
MNASETASLNKGVMYSENSIPQLFSSIDRSNIYEILNFVDVIKISTDGKLDIPQALIEVLNSISISTTRGVMFSTFKGTFLHNAVLPIIDPRQFQFAD